MPLLVVNNGEVVGLSYLVGKTTTVRDLVYRLFANNITPAETDTAATYAEAAGGGYAAKTLPGAGWTVTPGSPSSATYAQQTWTFTGALTTNPDVYGYYVTRATDADLIFAERMSTPFTPTTNGDQLLITPTLTAD